MIPFSVMDTVEVKPRGDNGPVYYMKPLKLRDRTHVNKSLIKEGFNVVSVREIRQELIDLLPALVSGADYDKALFLLTDQQKSHEETAGQDNEATELLMTSDETRLLRRIESDARKNHPYYASLIAAQYEWQEEYQRLLVKHSLCGIEGGSVEWKSTQETGKKYESTDDDVLDMIPYPDYQYLVSNIDGLAFVAEHDAKNSSSDSESA